MMKQIIFSVAMMFCVGMLSAQDIIATKDGKTIEDVTVISVTDENVTYNQNGTEKTILSSEVDGVLYADGRYVTPPKKNTIQEETVQEQDIPKKGKEIIIVFPSKREDIKERSNPAKEKDESSRTRKKACFDEAKKVYNNSYTEAYNQALQQGYSLAKAKKYGVNEANKAMMQFLEECANTATPTMTKTDSEEGSSASDGW